MESGIYAIINNITNKRYIGSYIDIRDRFWRHKSALRKNRHPNAHLQNSWTKYGEENFTFNIIEYTTDLLNRDVHRATISYIRSGKTWKDVK